MSIIDKLHDAVIKKGPICVGLDPREDMFPDYLIQKKMNIGDKIFEFNQKIIDATKEETACYKPQIACYEAYGLEGMKAYSKTVQYLKSQELISIGDIKRGDISSTAEMYAQGHFSGDFEVDFITVNAYMGQDAVSPYYKYLKTGEKGLFLLVRTSNKSSIDFQDVIVEREPLFIKAAGLMEEWGQQFVGESGFSAIGGVVGLTFPEHFERIKNKAPHMFFLIPGYGAQGGSGKDAARILGKELCGVINSSRGIIAAHKGKNETEAFAGCALNAVKEMKEDIMQWL